MFDESIRLLIVDDMKTMRKIVTKSCKVMGFTDFIEAEDGNKAWDALNGSDVKVGLVICDWNMPNCSGIDFLRRCRADDRFKKLPFVLLTAESELAQVKEAVLAGVDNYVVKPFSTEVLKGKLEETHKKISAAA